MAEASTAPSRGLTALTDPPAKKPAPLTTVEWGEAESKDRTDVAINLQNTIKAIISLKMDSLYNDTARECNI